MANTPHAASTARLLVNIVDQKAKQEASRPWLLIPRSSTDPKEGWKELTFKQAANAVNYVAHRLVKTHGEPPPRKFPTVAYIGPNDVRYLLFMFGAVKAGYQAFFMSPRNAHVAQISLLEQTSCGLLWFDSGFDKLVQPWLQERTMQTSMVPPLDDWLNDAAPFPYAKSFNEARWDPLVILHTSGSTGLPKPVYCYQGMVAAWDSYGRLPDWEGNRSLFHVAAETAKRLCYAPFPLFHGSGALGVPVVSLYYDALVALGIPGRPLSSPLVLESLATLNPDGIYLLPFVLEELSLTEEGLNALAKLKVVAFGGGPLPADAGNRLVRRGVNLQNFLGHTESFGLASYWQRDQNLWPYHLINSDMIGADWRQVKGTDDTFELVIVRKDKDPGLQGVFYTFPDAKEYSTKDIFRRHPTLPNQWLHVGRTDDLINFSFGLFLNPVVFENTISDHPDIKGVLVAGTNRFEPALLLEPENVISTEGERERLIDSVWPLVDRVNEQTVSYARINRNFIRITDPDKPFPRASKGSIQRGAALKLYEKFIDNIYEKEEPSVGKQLVDKH